jgi:hypothetical protein
VNTSALLKPKKIAFLALSPLHTIRLTVCRRDQTCAVVRAVLSHVDGPFHGRNRTWLMLE